MAKSIPHAYSPEQYARAVEIWRRLVESPHTSLREDRGCAWHVQDLDDDTLYALIMSDGAETDEDAVTLSLAYYSDYAGSDLDAANVRTLVDDYGWISGSYDTSDGEAWIQLGELPDTDDTDNGLAMLDQLVDDLDSLCDYPLLNEEAHSEHQEALKEEAWDAYMRSDVMGELDDVAPDPETFEPSYDATEEQEDAIRQTYYEYDGNEWVCESATSIVNTRHADAVRYVARAVFGWDVDVIRVEQEREAEREAQQRSDFNKEWREYLDEYPLPYFIRNDAVVSSWIYRCLCQSSAGYDLNTIREVIVEESEAAAYREL